MQRPLFLLISFCLLAIMLRFFSFFPSVIDHDESTYLEIARMLWSGKTLYVDMVDIKPPGIFLILAGAEGVLGYPVFVIRLFVAIWVGITAYILYLTSLSLIKDKRASIAAGVIYIFFISTWSYYGISITPEIFFNLFTITSLYVLLKRNGPSGFFLAGLLAGIGFIVKYLVIFDFAAFIGFFLFYKLRKKENRNLLRISMEMILAGIGFFLPFMLTNLWYYLNGHFDALYNIVYLAPAKYPAAFDAWKMLKFILDFHLRFIPLFLLFYFVVFQKKIKKQEFLFTKQLVLVWLLLATIAVLIAGKPFGHYTIQLMLPLSLMSGIFFHPDFPVPIKMKSIFGRKTAITVFSILVLLVSLMKIEYIIKRDVPREVAEYLKPELKPEDVIYTGNYHQIIYYLLQKDSPTKYIHRSLLIEEKHIRALNIDTAAEFRHIMAQLPAYIIVKDEYPVKMMQDFILEHYQLDREFEGKVRVYRWVEK